MPTAVYLAGAAPGLPLAQFVAMAASLISARITRSIVLLRGQKVILDFDLASLYEVETKALNQAVRRNLERFPADFMFRLTTEEIANLKSQIVTSSSWGGRRKRSYAFTEQGVAMLSSVLRSRRAVLVNVQIMRAFVELRRTLETTAGLARKLEALERRYDGQFQSVFEAIRQLMLPVKQSTRRIGYKQE